MSTARYGDAGRHAECGLYGAPGLLYGARSVYPLRRLTWSVAIDWDGDDVLDGTNEIGGLFDLESTNGRMNFIRGAGEDGFFPVDVGVVTLLYRNATGRLDPYNTEGPLYGQLLPGRRIEIRVVDEASGVIQPIMVGRVTDVRPNYGEVEQVKITAANGIDELQRINVRTRVRSVIRYDDAIDSLLATGLWSFGSVIDHTVSEVMPYWWAAGNSLWDELNLVSDAILGLLCVNEAGQVQYRSRVSGDASLASITGLDINRDYGVRSPAPQDVVRNHITVGSRPRILGTLGVLWSLSEVVKIPAHGTLTMWASFSFSGQDGVAKTVVSPVPTTDYLANTDPAGTGPDVTGSVSIDMYDFATSAKLIISNAGAVAAYMIFLRVRAVPIVVQSVAFVESLEQPSIDAFGDRAFEVNSAWLQDVNTASDIASLINLRLAYLRRFPRVQLNPNPALQFALRLFGLATVDIASREISGELRVGYLHHKWLDETGQTVKTEVYFEPNFLGATSGTWIFPAVFGLSTVF